MTNYFFKNVIPHLFVENIPDHLFKTQEMCNEIMRTVPYAFHDIPDRFKTQEMCIEAVELDPSFLWLVLDHLKTQKICDAAARDYPVSLQFVPDLFVTQQQIDKWDDDDYFLEGSEMIEWYEGYKSERIRMHKLKKSSCLLLGIHQDIESGVCQKMKKKETEKLWA